MMIFVHFKFNNMLNKRDNLALRANLILLFSQCINMKPLFSPKHMEVVIAFWR